MKCPHCGYGKIQQFFNYCPMCLRKLDPELLIQEQTSAKDPDESNLRAVVERLRQMKPEEIKCWCKRELYELAYKRLPEIELRRKPSETSEALKKLREQEEESLRHQLREEYKKLEMKLKTMLKDDPEAADLYSTLFVDNKL